nr:uncharacterized protein LOC123568839 [Macaca fascicularis]
MTVVGLKICRRQDATANRSIEKQFPVLFPSPPLLLTIPSPRVVCGSTLCIRNHAHLALESGNSDAKACRIPFSTLAALASFTPLLAPFSPTGLIKAVRKWTKRKKKALCLPGARSEPCAPRQPLLEGFLRSRSGLGCSWSASVGDGGSGDSRQNGCGARGGGACSLAPAPGARAALEQTQLEAQRRTGLYSRSARRGLAEPPRHRLRDLDKLLNLGTFFPYLEMEKSKSDGVLLCCPRCS